MLTIFQIVYFVDFRDLRQCCPKESLNFCVSIYSAACPSNTFHRIVVLLKNKKLKVNIPIHIKHLSLYPRFTFGSEARPHTEFLLFPSSHPPLSCLPEQLSVHLMLPLGTRAIFHSAFANTECLSNIGPRNPGHIPLGPCVHQPLWVRVINLYSF